MGTVYRAEHTLLGRLAAVKVLHPELCSNRDIVGRFFNEAKTTTSIKHPGIVEVFDFGYMDSGHAYLIMELLEGEALSRRMRERGPLPEGEAAVLLRGVCIALAAAHDKGIIHRDLKPDNIFVVPDPDSTLGVRTKLLDFGIAKLTEIGLASSATKTGAVMGTPTYMSPEQCRGTGDIDFRADLYSIGCVFYELVTGRPPFVHSGAGELIGSHLLVEPEPPSRRVAGLSSDTDTLIMTLLAKQPDQRVQTAKELAYLLGSIALQHGWISPADASRATLSHVALTPSQVGYRTPSGAPSTPSTPPKLLLSLTLTPVDGTAPPSGGAAGRGAPAVDALLGASDPAQNSDHTTTLSGAASQSHIPALARRWVRVAIGAGIFVTAGVVAAILAWSGPTEHGSRAATQPSLTAPPSASAAPIEPPTPPMPTTRPGAPTTIIVPRSIAARTTSTTPATAPPSTTPAAASMLPATAPATPASTASVTPPRPLPRPRPLSRPQAKHPATASPATKKPDDKPPAQPPGELLEQDI